MGEKYSVIIVAGGKGSRFGSSTPKQFLKLNGTPIISVTVQAFLTAYPLIELIIVLPEAQMILGKKILSHFPNIKIVKGGKERFYSVKNGLSVIGKNRAVIGIHDGVRPLVKTEVIFDCFEMAEKKQTAIPTIQLEDSIRQLKGENSIHVDRSDFVKVQTPQCFSKELILDAYKANFSNSFTDDASVVEAKGYQINLVSGNKENLKITTPQDLEIAQLLFMKKNKL